MAASLPPPYGPDPDFSALLGSLMGVRGVPFISVYGLVLRTKAKPFKYRRHSRARGNPVPLFFISEQINNGGRLKTPAIVFCRVEQLP
jgi:hypothetical protein